jgi:hypothetical protein
MGKVSDIVVLQISLRIKEVDSLFILLARDGAINRLGTGFEDNTERALFIGKTDPELFQKSCALLNDEMLQHTGGYEIEDRKGASCLLSVGFQFADNSWDGFEFSYGSQSQGPPKEIAEVVIETVRLTEPWYEAQKRMVVAEKQE